MIVDNSAFWILGTVFRGNANLLIQVVISWALAHNVSLAGLNPQLLVNLLHIIIEA